MDLSRVAEDLSFIRAAVSRSARFQAVSEPAVAATGLMATLASAASMIVLDGLAVPEQLSLPTVISLGSVWLGLFAVCAATNSIALFRRLRRFPEEERYAVWTSLLYAMVPVLAAGGVITAAMVRAEAYHLLPVCWLACYGSAQMAAASRSAPELSGAGLFTFLCAAGALLFPSTEILWLAVGLGPGHLLLALQLMRRHREVEA
jgi:hypothetical protein